MIKKYFFTALAALALGFIKANAQTCIINTVAGNGMNGYSGDGGPATAAGLAAPWGVAIDTSGNMYIADFANNVIRKVSPGGIISTVAGNGTGGYTGDGGAATAAELNQPFGVALDASGNMYIADYRNNVIRKVSPGGIISTVAGNGTGGYTGDGGAATAAELGTPFGVALDASGNMYIADANNYVIRKVSTGGIISTAAGNGTSGYSGDGGAATAAELNFPVAVAFDASGNIYIADEYNNRIRKVNTSGIITTIAGNGNYGYSGDGSAATAAELNQTTGVVVDASGNIYIIDFGNGRIRVVNKTSGIISTIAGNGMPGITANGVVATSTYLNYPHGVCVNGSNIYIANTGNDEVNELTAVAPITYFTANKTSVCVGNNVIFKDTSLYNPTVWQWTFTGGTPSTSSLQNPSITYNTAGTYAVKLKVTNSTGADSITKTSYITGNAFVLPTITITGNDSVSLGHQDTLTATGGGSYLWTTGSTNDTTIVSPTTATVYEVTVTNSFGCNAVDSFKVSIKVITTGIATLTNNSEISLYPNPANTVLNLSFVMQGLQTNATINVLDITGKIILKTESEISNGKILPINVSSLSAGFYFVKITTDKTTQTIKFVKQDN